MEPSIGGNDLNATTLRGPDYGCGGVLVVNARKVYGLRVARISGSALGVPQLPPGISFAFRKIG